VSDPLELMQALLGPGASPAQARDWLEQALREEADPLRFCATRLGLSEAEIMQRGARWADLAFFEVVPRLAHAPLQPHRLEALAAVRMFRLHLFDREVAFAAPDFFGLLRLGRRRRADPGLRGRVCLVPDAALRQFLATAAAPALLDGARQNLARRWPFAAAQLDLPRSLRWAFVLAVLGGALALLVAPLAGHSWVLPFWAIVVCLPTLLRLAALAEPLPPDKRLLPWDDPAELPVYSVLVPLRDEAGMVDQLCTALARLDYPPERLEIFFVVEQRSPETLAAVRRHLRDSRFHLVEVPDAPPRTKPKALAFALPLCRGDFVVVYDAEDRPEPDQLLRMVARFRAQPEVECIQARLVVDNGGTGFLQSQFAGEYAGLFSVLLPALARWRIVMPLGGTSNHFRTTTLRELGGWDAFNVTEDADLGVRLARRRLRTATSTSATFEAAPDSFSAWLGQRTRWMKGWSQTFLVHNRRPGRTRADLGLPGFLVFQVLLLGMIVLPLLHAAFGLTLLMAIWLGRLDWVFPPGQSAIFIAVLLLGQGVAIATNITGLVRTGQRRLWWTQFALPVYWMLIGLATVRALFELVHRPFHWFKTPHRAAAGEPRGVPIRLPASRGERPAGLAPLRPRTGG